MSVGGETRYNVSIHLEMGSMAYCYVIRFYTQAKLHSCVIVLIRWSSQHDALCGRSGEDVGAHASWCGYFFRFGVELNKQVRV